MTTHNEQMALTIVAAEDLSTTAARYKAVTFAGTLMATNPAAGTSGRAAGINLGSVTSGGHTTVVYRGITKVVAGVAVQTLGYPCMVGSSGFMFAASSGNTHCGRFIETCASGDMVRALVDFSTLPLWTGV